MVNKIQTPDFGMASSASPPLVLFARGVISTLNLWPALRAAVEGGWGGPESQQKRTWLASAIVDSFEDALTKSEPVPDNIYVEEMLLQVLSDEFDVILEDGSAQQVGESIVKLWQEVMQEGRTDGVARLEALVQRMSRVKVNVEEGAASDDEFELDDEAEEEESNEDDEEVPQLVERERIHDKPEIDEDGFTLVRGRPKRHR